MITTSAFWFWCWGRFFFAHQSSSSPSAASCSSLCTASISSAHRSGGVVGAHIRYSTFPSGRAWIDRARSRDVIAFAAPLLYPPPPSPSSTSTANTHPIAVTPATFGR